MTEELLLPGRSKCKKCGFAFKKHAISSPEEIEFLRSLGYGVFVCRDLEDNPLLGGTYLEVVAMSEDGKFLNTYEIEEMYKNREPDDPCDSEFMEDIST